MTPADLRGLYLRASRLFSRRAALLYGRGAAYRKKEDRALVLAGDIMDWARTRSQLVQMFPSGIPGEIGGLGNHNETI
jgi:hypothetical protein